MVENKETQTKIAQLQLLQQNLQTLLIQKQQFQLQMNEMDSALSELTEAKRAYKIIGNIMLLSTRESIEKDLKEKKDMVELRLKNIEAQEERFRKKAEELQQEVVKELKKEK